MGYNVENVTLDGKPASDPIRGSRRTFVREPDVCGATPSPTGSGGSSPSSSLGFFSEALMPVDEHRPPGFPQYITFDSRLNSFPRNWKEFCPVNANSLAEAGFFYFGPTTGDDPSIVILDAVACFHCKRKACKWEETDDPWVEHRKLTGGNCYFLNLNYDHHRPSTQVTPSTSQPTEPQDISKPSSSDPKEEAMAAVGQSLSCLASKFSETSLSSDDQARCKVCYSKDIEILFLPCRHVNCCAGCATAVTKCPTCRASIEGSVRIYLS